MGYLLWIVINACVLRRQRGICFCELKDQGVEPLLLALRIQLVRNAFVGTEFYPGTTRVKTIWCGTADREIIINEPPAWIKGAGRKTFTVLNHTIIDPTTAKVTAHWLGKNNWLSLPIDSQR